MSYLERLKQISLSEFPRRAPPVEPPKLPEGACVGSVSTAKWHVDENNSAQEGGTNAQWREFETLLAIVGPAYRTPEHEYAEMREAARSELANALIAYRELAHQVVANA